MNDWKIKFTFAKKEHLSAARLFHLAEQSYKNGSPWSMVGFEQDLENPCASYAAAFDQQELIGYIGYHHILDEIEITNVVVDKQYQQKGIASGLLHFCLGQFAVDQVKQVFLEVRQSNSAAIQLYEKYSFEKSGVRKKYYANPEEDALIMQMKVIQKNV